MGQSAKFVITLCAFAAFGFASADVTFFDIFKTADFEQTSDSQPMNPVNWRFNSRIETDSDDQALSGTLTLPDQSIRAFTQSDPRTLSFGEEGFSNSTDLDIAFPDGPYLFSIDSGTLAGWTGEIREPAADYPDAVPYLTNNGYSALQNADPNSSISVTWNGFGHGGGGDSALVFFDIFDQTDGVYILDHFGDQSVYQGDTIGAGTLIAGHQYTYNLFYSVRFNNNYIAPDGGFGIAGFDFATSGDFTAVPEPATLAAFVLGAVGFARRRRRIQRR